MSILMALIIYANVQCGIPPIPPVGCKQAVCICDDYGMNCRWEFICN